MDLGLRDKVVLITGASGGIGLATARTFAEEGAKLVLNYHGNRSELLEAIKTENIAVRADVADEAEVAKLFSEAVKRFGGIDVLVANAGIFPPEDLTIDRMGLDRFEKVMNVNAKGVWLTCREFLKCLRKTGQKSAAIILVSSTSAVFGEYGHGEYSMSKAALHGLMLTLKNEIVRIAPRGRVNCVAPGWTWTPMSETFKEDKEGILEALRTRAIRRIGRPEDVARQILFLASDECSGGVTGQVVRVDFGMEGRVLWDENEIDLDQA